MAILQQVQPQSYSSRESEIDRSRKLAKLLQEGANNTALPNKMVGDRVVAVSPLEALFKGLQSGYSSYLDSNATQDANKIEEEKRNSLVQALKGGGGIDELVQSGALDSDSIAKLLVNKAKQQEAQDIVKTSNPSTSYIPPGAKLDEKGQFFTLQNGAMIPNIYGVRPSNDIAIQEPLARAVAGAKDDMKTEWATMSDGSKQPIRNGDARQMTNIGGQQLQSPMVHNAMPAGGTYKNGMERRMPFPSQPKVDQVSPENLQAMMVQMRADGVPEDQIKQAMIQNGAIPSDAPTIGESTAQHEAAQLPAKMAFEQEKQRLAIDEASQKKVNEQTNVMNDPQRLKSIEDADNAINAMISHYDSLKKHHGIVDTEANAMSNLGTSFNTSGIGQALGGMVGTPDQSDRQSIEGLQSSMIPLLMKASGMTGGMLNSEAELKNVLKSFGGTNQTYQSVIEQLHRMKNMYGNRSAEQEKPKTSNLSTDDLVNMYSK